MVVSQAVGQGAEEDRCIGLSCRYEGIRCDGTAARKSACRAETDIGYSWRASHLEGMNGAESLHPKLLPGLTKWCGMVLTGGRSEASGSGTDRL